MSDLAYPLQRPADTANDYTAFRFLALQQLLRVQTMTLVQVQTVHGGGIGATPTVDVLPLADQVDGAGNAIPQVTLYGRPCLRIAAGSNALILDPQQGDIGVMGFCSRDMSSILASRQHGPPPTGRIFSYADGIYLGAIPSEAPTQYIFFGSSIALETPEVDASDNLSVGNGATGTFTTGTGQTVDVIDGIVVNIY